MTDRFDLEKAVKIVGLNIHAESADEGKDFDVACRMIVNALNEIQQYRAIGTVEQLKTMFDGFWKMKDLCEEYKKFGLPEDYWKLNEMCKDYSAIGTIEEFKALKEKSVARKPIERKRNYLTVFDCPTCNAELYSGQRFCDECGQSISDDYD